MEGGESLSSTWVPTVRCCQIPNTEVAVVENGAGVAISSRDRNGRSARARLIAVDDGAEGRMPLMTQLPRSGISPALEVPIVKMAQGDHILEILLFA